MKRIISKEHEGLLLRDYLKEVLQLSSRLIKRVKSLDGKLLINGKKVTVSYQLREGDDLEVVFPKETRSESIRSEFLPLDIVYEDNDLLLINKQALMPSIPSRLHPTGTVANRLLGYYETKQLPYTIHIVTRLDKDTSGLMLIAKHQYSHSLLATLQNNKQIHRTYEAIVHGRMGDVSGTIDQPIGRDEHSIIKRTVTAEGKRAITHYEVLKKYDHYTHVGVRLETGRTHQIRVHFAAIGHPLVGDDLYGGKKELIDRQALHCTRIQFQHPFTGEIIDINSPLPNDMDAFLQMM